MDTLLSLQQMEKSLKDEVDVLEEQLQYPRQQEVHELLVTALGKTHEEPGMLSSYGGIKHLQSELSLLQRLTDINISEVNKSQETSVTIQKIKGDVLGVPFDLKFSILETSEGAVSGSEIQNLCIKVSKTLPDHIINFISRCEKNQSVQDFFQGIRLYVQWNRLKEKTLSHFKNKYNGLVILTNIEENLILQIKTQQETYTLTWDNVVNESLTVHPVIDLYITMPVTEDGASHQELSNKFQNLLEVHGIEAAIDIFRRIIPFHRKPYQKLCEFVDQIKVSGYWSSFGYRLPSGNTPYV